MIHEDWRDYTIAVDLHKYIKDKKLKTPHEAIDYFYWFKIADPVNQFWTNHYYQGAVSAGLRGMGVVSCAELAIKLVTYFMERKEDE